MLEAGPPGKTRENLVREFVAYFCLLSQSRMKTRHGFHNAFINTYSTRKIPSRSGGRDRGRGRINEEKVDEKE